jgi:hypothetical protein
MVEKRKFRSKHIIANWVNDVTGFRGLDQRFVSFTAASAAVVLQKGRSGCKPKIQ